MRVIAGQCRGTKLHTPPGNEIRPTADRLREAIFNIIGHSIRDKHVLDLYAGTGAMGIEALSRGAAHAVFIDNNPMALDLIRRNIAKVKMGRRATVIHWDISHSLAFLKKRRAPDIIFIDPPYCQGFVQRTLANLVASQILLSMIVVEHDPSETLGNQKESLKLKDQRRYGKTLVSFLNGVI